MQRSLIRSCCLMALLAAPAIGAGSLRLLPNQDFESEPLGWSLWPSSSASKVELDKTVVHQGKQALRVTALRSSDRAIVNTVTDNFEIDTIYRIGVWVRRDASVPDSAISYCINLRGGEKMAIKQRAYPVKLEKQAHGEWTRWSGLFCVPEGIQRWQFCLGVEHTVGRVWFDDIEIEKLGKTGDLRPDVWTYLPMGVEIGDEPLRRFAKHKSGKDAVYKMAARYNALLMESALVEKELRDLERCRAYAGREAPARLRAGFGAAEKSLNQAYLAYGQAFRSGRDADWQPFSTAADKLERALESLRTDLRKQVEALRPDPAPALPDKLGRQDRSVQALTPTGKMNRLLFGCWSPTQWAEFEKPFELEFHSSGPGEPKVHTETATDFSNITKACARIEEAGYSGTFGYLMFGIHDNMYAPKWFLDKHKSDPDLFKTSWDGQKGKSYGNRHSLNYCHPAVREFIRQYLRKYAEFCRGEPRLLFYETSQEAYIDFGTAKGRRMSGYGPSALKAFHDYLGRKYKTVQKLNQAWGARYERFDAIEPPPDAYVKREQRVTPLFAEFQAFRDDAYIGYLKLIYDSIKAGDPTKPVVARHSSLLSGINGARIFETCDVLSYHNRAPKMQLGNVYLNTINRYHHKGLGYMEDFWGVQQERTRSANEVVQRRGLEKHIARVCIWGRTLQMKWYAYTGGMYLTTYNGNWFNPRYDVATMRYCAPAIAVAKRKMEALDWVLTHSEIAASRILVMQPSATMRNERPGTAAFSEIAALHELLFGSGLLYELAPEEYVEDGRCKLSEFDVVMLPRASWLSEDLQQKLGSFVLRGGLLVALGRPGEYDEIARPSGQLAQRLRDRSAQWAEVEQVWQGAGDKRLALVPCGKGRIAACESMAGLAASPDRERLRQLVESAAPRAAWSQEGRFEVVLRIAEDGARYLFLLNPDVDRSAEDEVHVAKAVRAALDVSIAGGFPVPVNKAGDAWTMRMRLGPGECAVLYLSD